MISIIILELTIGYLKRIADYLEENGTKTKTWKNKYKPGLLSIPKSLYGEYHKLMGLSYAERFPLSGTFFVFLTDKWHLINTLIHICRLVQIGVMFGWGFYLIGLYFVMPLGFHISGWVNNSMKKA